MNEKFEQIEFVDLKKPKKNKKSRAKYTHPMQE